ncbi:response regulator [Methanolobus profundi]|uniref:Response regulator receiver domain-containing protein n=1 Tax=Methanolobus profundi TaxID=487685 RepID=A0A1I4UI66_9EURY|nr:response regulator [Methanolobus profundi]SFM88605.1 Response regulator receiver domain-containing protein [Methanolobus profundi]
MNVQTQEILSTLRGELTTKNALFLAPVDSSIERLVYFYISGILREEPQRTVVWLCLSASRDKVLSRFEDFGFDIDPKGRMLFIDIDAPGKEHHDDTLYCSSVADYTKMASHISNIFLNNPSSLLVMDNMNVLASDTMQVVENFVQFIEKKVAENEGSLLSILSKNILPPETEVLISSFFDVVIEITNVGEIHTEIGLKDFDFRYSVEDGSIEFEPVQKRIKRDRLKILIVDDEPDIPELLKLSLSSEPYDFLVAHNGEEAIELTLKELPDLILLDIMMPDMDGYEVVEHLKKSKSANTIPVIMVSAKTAIEDKVKGMELGIDDYISKPFDKREVKARIKMVMRRLGWVDEE